MSHEMSCLFKGKLNPVSDEEAQREIRTRVSPSSTEREIASVEMLPNPQAPLAGDS